MISENERLEKLADLPVDIDCKTYPYQWFSLICRQNYKDDSYINYFRLADIDLHKLTIRRFVQPKGRIGRFENRKNIHSKQLLEHVDGYCCVANWETHPKAEDSTKDWINAEETKIKPVAIYTLENCDNIDAVITCLKKGIKLPEIVCKWAITYQQTYQKSTQEAILVQQHDMEMTKDGVKKLKICIYQLPVYHLEVKKFIDLSEHIDCKRIFYEDLFLGKPYRVAKLKKSEEIIRDVLLENATWKNFKNDKEISKKSWQKFREILNDVACKNIYQKLQDMIGYSESEAIEQVKKFLYRVEEYIDGKDIDSQVIYKLVKHSPELLSPLHEKFRQEWEKENLSILTKERQLIEEEIEKKCAEAKKGNNDLKELSKQKEDIQQYIEQAEKTKNILNDKLVKLRIDSTEFFSNAILNNYFLQEIFAGNTQVSALSFKRKPVYSQLSCKLEETEEYLDEVELFDVFAENLSKCGVDDKYSSILAAYLYSCYIKNVPLIMAGPEGASIASVLGLMKNGQLPIIVDLPQEYDTNIMEEIKSSNSSMLILRNALTSSWTNYIDKIFQLPEKYIVFLVPFQDDLQLLPKGVISYGIPILTELILNKDTITSFTFSVAKRAFSQKPRKKVISEDSFDICKKMRLFERQENRYLAILKEMHEICIACDINRDSFLLGGLLLAILPNAYMRGYIDTTLQDAMENANSNQLKETLKRISWLLGVELNE